MMHQAEMLQLRARLDKAALELSAVRSELAERIRQEREISSNQQRPLFQQQPIVQSPTSRAPVPQLPPPSLQCQYLRSFALFKQAVSGGQSVYPI